MPEPPRTPRVGRVQARYVRRVTPDERGQRVSVRHLVDDPDRGPVPTDTVGRLIGHDGEVLTIVDRDGDMHLVDARQVLSSRVIPPHPRLPPEPDVGTEDRPLRRQAARVLLLDAADRVLLVRFEPAPGERIWSAPGGGLARGETHREAALRELREELDLEVVLGPWIWTRTETFPFRGVWIEQGERWYLARTDASDGSDADGAPLDDVGLEEARWWTVQEVADADDRMAPANLADLVAAILRDGPPEEPRHIPR